MTHAQALGLQNSHSEDATQRNMSDTIWNSLRMAVSMLNDAALAEHAVARRLPELRRALGMP